VRLAGEVVPHDLRLVRRIVLADRIAGVEHRDVVEQRDPDVAGVLGEHRAAMGAVLREQRRDVGVHRSGAQHQLRRCVRAEGGAVQERGLARALAADQVRPRARIGRLGVDAVVAVEQLVVLGRSGPR
jgi:hypothetical protein